MKKFLLTLLTVLIGTSMMSAEEVTFDFLKQDYGLTRQPSGYAADGTALTENGGIIATLKNNLSDATNASGVRLWADGLRFYKGGTITIAAPEGKHIAKITMTGAKGTGTVANIGTSADASSNLTDGTWTGEANSVCFYYTATSSNQAIGTMTVTLADGGSGGDTELAEPEISWGDETSYSVVLGEAFEAPTLTNPKELPVTYESSNTSVATIDSNGTIDIVGAGTTTISAEFAGNETYKASTVSYTLNVIDPNDISTEISVDDFGNTTSYTAYTYTDDYGVKYSTVYYYSGGVMQYNTSNNNGKGSGLNITANNSDYIVRSIDIEFASGGKGVYIYSSSTPFDALAKTTTPNYSSYTKVNTTPITSSTSNIGINAKAFAIVPSASGSIQINKITVHYELEATDTREEATLTFTPAQESYTITYGDTFTEPTLTVDPAEAASEVEYSSSNTEVATVDAEGKVTILAAGETTITAAIKDSETYKDVEESYTLNVSVNVSSLTDFLAAKPTTTTVIPEPVTVYYQSPDKKYMFITDGTTNMMVYGTLSNTYQNGDVLTGIAGTYTEYGGMDELIPDASTFGEATEGTPVEPKAVTLAEEIAPCDFVILTGVDITGVSGTNATVTDGTNSISAFDRFGLSLAATENATIVAIGAVYNSTKQIYIVSVTETPDTREEVTLTFSETECSAVFGDAFIEPTLAVNPAEADEEVQYSSSNTEVATVDPTSGKVTILAAGNTTITAAIKESEIYKDVEVSYTLTVIELGAIMFNDFVLDEAHMCGAFVGTPVTISAANAEAMSYTIDGGDLVEVEGSSFTWTPEAVGNYAFSVSAYLGGQDKTVNFTVTVEEQTIEATLISDVLTLTCFEGAAGSYSNLTYESEKGLTYAANMANGNSSIQLRSSNSNSGIVVSANKYGLVAQAATIKWNSNTSSNRALSFYGQQTAFTAPTELYNTEAESLGEKNIDDGAEQTIVFTEDFRYIGLRSKNGAQYVDKIELIWTLPEPTVYIGEQNAPTIISQLPATLEFATTADEFVKVYYKFEEDGIAAVAAADGYTEVPAEGLTINSFGVLSYYAEVNGWTSNLSTIKFADTTGIVEIEGSEAGEAQWYDLNGRRVAAPGKGIYILKQGNKATKYAF